MGHTLRELARRRQAAFVALAAFTGPVLLALLEPAAPAMRGAVDPAAPFLARFASIVTWIAVTTLLVLALREAVFMQGARGFLRALPVSRVSHWLADAAGIVVAYGVLWILLAYGAHRMLSGPRIPGIAMSLLTIAAALAIAILAQTLLGQVSAPEWIAATGAAALLWAAAPAVGGAGQVALLADSLALLCALAFCRYERPRRAQRLRLRRARAPGPARFALEVLRYERFEAVALRLGGAIAIVAAGAALAANGGFCAKAWGVGVAQLAALGLVLHRLPALAHEVLTGAIGFLFRLRGARRRAMAALFGVAASAFASSAMAAAGAWRLECGALDLEQWRLSWVLFGSGFVAASLAAPRMGTASSWICAVGFGVVALALATAA